MNTYETPAKKACTLHPDAFPYRAWAIMVTGDPEIFTQVVKRAVKEAKKYAINRIEFHDFLYPAPAPEGYVDNVVRYENFPKLKGIQKWTYERRLIDPEGLVRVVTNEELDKNVEHFRQAAAIVKEAGLKLNVWCHSFRELPQEFYHAYGDQLNPDSEFLYDSFGLILDEFLRKIPEVDGLTLTSLGETKSINDIQGTTSQADRMEKFYRTAHRVCAKYEKELILRDFGGGEDFWMVAQRLPKDIIYMTKWMPTDWERVNMPMSDRLMMAKGHQYVVEWDLRGEYLGQGFFPYVNPKHFWYNLINTKLFLPMGCVGRIHWTDYMGKQYEWDTVFDVPNGLNVDVFSRAMSETSRYYDSNYLPGIHAQHLPYHWIREWIQEHYGDKAWPALYEILRETPGIVERLSTCADRFHTNHSFPRTAFGHVTYENVKAMVEQAGEEYIVESKKSAASRAMELAAKIENVEIEDDQKKQALKRSFKVMAVFAELHCLWIRFYVRVNDWKDSGAKEPMKMAALLKQTIRESKALAGRLDGGIAKMADERLDRYIPQLEEWIANGGEGIMRYY